MCAHAVNVFTNNNYIIIYLILRYHTWTLMLLPLASPFLNYCCYIDLSVQSWFHLFLVYSANALCGGRWYNINPIKSESPKLVKLRLCMCVLRINNYQLPSPVRHESVGFESVQYDIMSTLRIGVSKLKYKTVFRV